MTNVQKILSVAGAVAAIAASAAAAQTLKRRTTVEAAAATPNLTVASAGKRTHEVVYFDSNRVNDGGSEHHYDSVYFSYNFDKQQLYYCPEVRGRCFRVRDSPKTSKPECLDMVKAALSPASSNAVAVFATCDIDNARSYVCTPYSCKAQMMEEYQGYFQ